MHARGVLAFAIGGTLLVAAGCRKTNMVDKAAFKSAINNYLSARQECVWSAAIKFPAQADTSKEDQTKGFDALTDAGLLVRTSAEKKRFLVGSKQVNNYDLSDKGRSVWTADTQQPGFGNFCYGHRKVDSIDSSTPTTSNVGATTQVNYHYSFSDATGWASAAETQNAYPQIRADLAGPQMGQVTLTNTNEGWAVSSARGDHNPVANADGKIVE